MRGTLSALAAILTTSIASAAPKAGDTHQPPVALDPTTLSVSLSNQGGDSGYKAEVEFIMMGATSATDRVRFEWKQKGKVLAKGECGGRYNPKFKSLSGKCATEATLTAKGPIDIDIIYTDDQTDTDYLVTKLAVDVRRWQGIGKFIDWGIVPDDLLALAFVKYASDGPKTRNSPYFSFWTTAPLAGKDPTFRCTVDGKRLPDFEGSLGNYGIESAGEVKHTWTRPKDSRTYAYYHYGVNPGFAWGTKEETAQAYGTTADKMSAWPRMAADNPGKWDCAMRIDGKVVRRFLFDIDAKGRFAPSELSRGAWPGLATFDDMVMVDMRIPEDNGFEQRIRKDALQKSVGFGMPWPASPKAAEAKAAFPKSMGTPD